MKSRKFIAKVAMFTLAGTTVLGSGAALLAKPSTAKCVVSIKRKCKPTKPSNTCKPIKPIKPGCGQGVGSDNNSNTDNDQTGNNNGNNCDNIGNSNTGNGCGNTGNDTDNNNNNENMGGNTGNDNSGNNTDNNENTGSNTENDNNSNTDDNINNENNNGNTGSDIENNNGNNNTGDTGTDNGTTEEKPEEKPETPDSGNTSTQKSFEDQVLVLVNQERANYGLSPLTMDESLRNVARVKSSDMSTNNYFSHTSPTYGSPFDMLKTFGIKYSAAAENIAQGYTSPEAVVKGWMNSSGHRANILNARYTKMGVGYEANGNYWTQLFTA